VTLLQQLRNSARATHCRQIIPLAQWKPTLFSGGRSSTLSVAAAVSMATGQRQTERLVFLLIEITKQNIGWGTTLWSLVHIA